MTFSFDDALGEAAAVSETPPLRAYGLSPGPAGYSLADLRCAPSRNGWRADGLYSEFGVGLVLSGAFEYAGDSGAGTAVPGSLVFANRDEVFSCRHLSADGNRRLVVFFAAELLETIADDLSLNDATFPMAGAPPSRLTPLLSAFMLRIAQRRDDSEEAAAAIAEAAFRPEGDWSGPERSASADERRIVDVLRHINAHFAAPCTLDALASIAGMSRFRFARRFRAVTGETATQYVLSRRLSAAASQLFATTRPVSEIAYEVGFNDLSYFYARFKSAFGRAPGAWRVAQRR